MKLKPLPKNPIIIMAIGAVLVAVAALMEAYLPVPEEKAIDSTHFSTTAVGLLGLCGLVLCLWPVLKPAWELWQKKKK